MGSVATTDPATDDPRRMSPAQPTFHEHKELYRRLFEAESDAIFVVDCESGRFVEANPSAERMYGHSREELLALGVADISAEAEKSLAAIQEKVTSVASRWHRRKDGTIFPVEISGGYLELAGRRMHVAAIRDISERRRDEAVLRLHSAIISTMAEGVCLVRVSDQVIVYANPRFERMFGYGPGEMNGLPVVRANYETDTRTASDAAREIISQLERCGEATYEVQNVRKDGTSFWCQAHTSTLDHPDFGKVWVGVHQDITARKQIEEALEQSKERMQLVLEAANDGLWDWDIRNGMAYLSPRYYEMTGYQPGEVWPDMEFYKRLVHPDDLGMVLRTMGAHLEGRTNESVFEHRMIMKDGSVKWMLAKGRVMERDPAGAPLRMVGTISDITERKRAEWERAAALARLAVVEEQERQRIARELHDQTAQQLVAMAVELKNLETDRATGRPQDQRVKALRRTVDELQRHIREIAWDLRAGESTRDSLPAALRDYLDEWSERARVAADWVCLGLENKRLPAAVEATLYRVAQEALSNVEKHAQARRVSVLLEREDSLVRLIVEDDGRGFDPESLDAPASPSGRLGLLGMKERVALVGGTLVIESTPASGTTILVRIPLPGKEDPS